MRYSLLIRLIGLLGIINSPIAGADLTTPLMGDDAQSLVESTVQEGLEGIEHELFLDCEDPVNAPLCARLSRIVSTTKHGWSRVNDSIGVPTQFSVAVLVRLALGKENPITIASQLNAATSLNAHRLLRQPWAWTRIATFIPAAIAGDVLDKYVIMYLCDAAAQATGLPFLAGEDFGLGTIAGMAAFEAASDLLDYATLTELWSRVEKLESGAHKIIDRLNGHDEAIAQLRAENQELRIDINQLLANTGQQTHLSIESALPTAHGTYQESKMEQRSSRSQSELPMHEINQI